MPRHRHHPHRRVLTGACLVAVLAACDRTRADDAPVFAALDSVAVPAAPGSGEPNLAVGADGRVHLTWIEPAADSASAVRVATYGDSGWMPPRTITQSRTLLVNWADFPVLAAMPGNRLMAYWPERMGPERGAYAVRLSQSMDGGATWSAPVSPHRDDTATEHGFVSFFTDGDSLGAVWLDGRRFAAGLDGRPFAAADGEAGEGTDETMLLATTISPAGVASQETFLDTRACDCCQTSAATTARGPVVVYRDRSPAEIRDIAMVRRVDGRWTGPAIVHADGWRIEGCPVNGPAVAALGDSVVVAWFTAAGDTARVNVAFSSDAGATFGEAVRVDAGAPVGRVAVVLEDDGSALVSWLEQSGARRAELLVRRVGTGGRLSVPQVIAEVGAARASGFPRMVRAGGDAWLAWTEPGTPARVRVARARLPKR